MKAGEIRVGNLLQWKDGNYVDKVHHLNFDGEVLMEGGHGYIDELKGVPITEELLVKFGFKWKEETARPFEKYWSNGIAAIDLVRQKFYIMRFKEGENHAEIKLPNYAHNLQNLHYALTKTELTLK